MPDFQGRYLKQGTSGTYGSESLPNIKGSLTKSSGADALMQMTGAQTSALGALYVSSYQTKSYFALGGSSSMTMGVSFDASKSSSVYKNSSKVNPDNAEILYCIKY